VLARLSPIIAGDGTVVLALERRRFDYAYTHYARIDDDSVARYQAYFAAVDPVFEPVLRHAPPGELLLSDALVPARQLRRTEFYADWLRPHAYGSGAAAAVTRCGSAQAALYAVRPRGRGPFAPRDIDALRVLLPHIAAAVRISLRLASLGAERDVAAAALDHWDEAVLVVDGLARVHAANRTAHGLLRSRDGLELEPGAGLGPGRLRAATATGTAALRRLIAAAAAIAIARPGAKGAEPAPPRQAALALVRPSGRPALAAYVAPLSPQGAASAPWSQSLTSDVPRAAAIVFVANAAVAGDTITAGARLRADYRLTAAEAAVAVAVASGDGLLAVAAARGVGLATVRTQAQQVYRKTGVRGQVALARLVARLAQAR
jgi:DNA-binding CsgD family transcriptional regulator